MLDEIYQDLREQDLSDVNNYYLGQIHNHNIVIAGLPPGIYGTAPAATVAKDMLRIFRSLGFGLRVGISGVAPSQAQANCTIFANEDWVTQDGQNILWLARDYRPYMFGFQQ